MRADDEGVHKEHGKRVEMRVRTSEPREKTEMKVRCECALPLAERGCLWREIIQVTRHTGAVMAHMMYVSFARDERAPRKQTVAA